MSALIKTPEQIEVADIFARLESEYQMTKAEVARELNVSRGYVGMLIEGERNPPLRTLQQFRDLEAKRKATKAHGEKNAKEVTELESVCSRIALMEQHDRPNFEVVKRVVESLTPTNSKSASAAARLLKKGAASVRKPS